MAALKPIVGVGWFLLFLAQDLASSTAAAASLLEGSRRGREARTKEAVRSRSSFGFTRQPEGEYDVWEPGPAGPPPSFAVNDETSVRSSAVAGTPGSESPPIDAAADALVIAKAASDYARNLDQSLSRASVAHATVMASSSSPERSSRAVSSSTAQSQTTAQDDPSRTAAGKEAKDRDDPNRCDGAKDGVSGCRDCCGTNDFNDPCVESCMAYG